MGEIVPKQVKSEERGHKKSPFCMTKGAFVFIYDYKLISSRSFGTARFRQPSAAYG